MSTGQSPAGHPCPPAELSPPAELFDPAGTVTYRSLPTAVSGGGLSGGRRVDVPDGTTAECLVAAVKGEVWDTLEVNAGPAGAAGEDDGDGGGGTFTTLAQH